MRVKLLTSVVAVTLAFMLGLVVCDNALSSYELVYGWKELDYKFESPQTKSRMIRNEEFIPGNNIITGVKVSGSKLFLTVPRWREGVPATLVYVEYSSNETVSTDQAAGNGPSLIAYPSWAMNQLGNCNAFQHAQSIEIDQYNRMWVVDVGRINIFTTPINKCPPKLVLIDLITNQVVHRYEFPSNVVSPTGNFLKDLAVGCISNDNCWIYITDALESKIIIYNYQQNKSWFVKHSSMVADTSALQISILGVNYTFNTNVDGITLSSLDTQFDRLYYCPMSSYSIYSIHTQTLQSANNGVVLEDNEVKDHGRKSSQSDGMVMDSKGLLFYGLLRSNAVSYWNSSDGIIKRSNEGVLVQNDIDLQWPDTFSFDDKGYLFATTNRLHRFSTDTYDFSEVNFRVIRIFVGSKSYMYSSKDKISTTTYTTAVNFNQSQKSVDSNMNAPVEHAMNHDNTNQYSQYSINQQGEHFGEQNHSQGSFDQMENQNGIDKNIGFVKVDQNFTSANAASPVSQTSFLIVLALSIYFFKNSR